MNDTQKLLKKIDDQANAAELTKTLMGSSGNGGLDVYDAALAMIDLHLARLRSLTEESK